jgi:hypothetical protein
MANSLLSLNHLTHHRPPQVRAEVDVASGLGCRELLLAIHDVYLSRHGRRRLPAHDSTLSVGARCAGMRRRVCRYLSAGPRDSEPLETEGAPSGVRATGLSPRASPGSTTGDRVAPDPPAIVKSSLTILIEHAQLCELPTLYRHPLPSPLTPNKWATSYDKPSPDLDEVLGEGPKLELVQRHQECASNLHVNQRGRAETGNA